MKKRTSFVDAADQDRRQPYALAELLRVPHTKDDVQWEAISRHSSKRQAEAALRRSPVTATAEVMTITQLRLRNRAMWTEQGQAEQEEEDRAEQALGLGYMQGRGAA